jgi:hypothetical protein
MNTCLNFQIYLDSPYKRYWIKNFERNLFLNLTEFIFDHNPLMHIHQSEAIDKSMVSQDISLCITPHT